MILDAAKTATRIRTHRFNGGLWVGAALLTGLGGAVGLSLTLLSVLNRHAHELKPEDYALFPCCVLFTVALPAAAAVLSIRQAVRAFRLSDALTSMLSCARPDGTFDREEHLRLVGKVRFDQCYVDCLASGGLRPSAKTAESSQPYPLPATGGPGYARHAVSPQHAATLAAPSRPSPMSSIPAHASAPYDTSPSAASPHGVSAYAATTHPQSPRPIPSSVPAGGFPVTSGTPPPEPVQDRASAEQLVGKTLKQTYFVEGLLAAGGMGCVYTARHVRTGRRYAVKTLLPDERVSLESLQRFEREARTASSLGHAGIVQVHDFELDTDPRYLVMDLLVGETLEQRLARIGRLPWNEVKKLALEVAEALHAAHAAGVLHRDLKPSNVFLATREGLGERAILLDFGLAKPIREGASVWVTRTGAIVGTAHYMSPEQARGERNIDIRSDVYGLAALLYETIAGVPPFLGSSPFAVLTSLLTEQPVPPSHLMQGVPPALDALLLRALAKNPKERPSDTLAFAQELHAIP